MGGSSENKKDKNNKNNENNEPKKKRNRRGKKEKQGEQTGNVVDAVAAAVVKPGTAPPKPAPTPTPKGYCFRCGEDRHSAKQCSHTGDLKCPLHPGSVSHMQKACTNWRRQNNLRVHPKMIKHKANQVVFETP